MALNRNKKKTPLESPLTNNYTGKRVLQIQTQFSSIQSPDINVFYVRKEHKKGGSRSNRTLRSRPSS